MGERSAPQKGLVAVEIVDEVAKSASGTILRRLLVERERAQSAG